MTMAHEQDRSVILVSPEPCPKEFLDAVSSPKTSASATLVPADGSALLRERVEQQSSLIAMLKQRNDETFRELSNFRGLYERKMEKNQELQSMLVEVSRAKATLEQRFQTLCSNHEELIGIMDEYKSDNKRLRAELQTKKGAAELREKDEELVALRDEVREKEEEVEVMRRRCTLLEREVEELEKGKMELEMVYREEQEKDEDRQKAAQQKFAKAEDRIKEIEKDVRELRERNRELEESSSLKDEAVNAKLVEVDRLQKQVESLKSDKKTLSEQLEQLSVELSLDVQMKKLREQLSEEQKKRERLQKEYLAYQKHSSDLLHKEKELNAKLRHMSDQ